MNCEKTQFFLNTLYYKTFQVGLGKVASKNNLFILEKLCLCFCRTAKTYLYNRPLHQEILLNHKSLCLLHCKFFLSYCNNCYFAGVARSGAVSHRCCFGCLYQFDFYPAIQGRNWVILRGGRRHIYNRKDKIIHVKCVASLFLDMSLAKV